MELLCGKCTATDGSLHSVRLMSSFCVQPGPRLMLDKWTADIAHATVLGLQASCMHPQVAYCHLHMQVRTDMLSDYAKLQEYNIVCIC